VLVRSFTSFLHLLKSIFRLLEKSPPSRLEDIIAASAESFQLDRDLMNRLLDFKRKKTRLSHGDIEELFEEYLDLLYEVIGVVDRLSVGQK